MVTIAEQIKKHNKKVTTEFERAQKGEIINLTDLMISKEKIDKRLGKY